MKMDINKIEMQLKESADAKMEMAGNSDEILKIAELIVNCYRSGRKVVLFGNGGSAADAQHLAAEFVSKFRLERRGLPAIALNTNTSIMTAIANDYEFGRIFERQVESIVNEGDVAIGITTSGDSDNVIRGLLKAKEKNATTIAFTGRSGGKVKDVADITLKVPSDDTPRIQEVHITVGHIICEIVEEEIANEKGGVS